MENKIKRRKIFHRIKYRNSIVPSASQYFGENSNTFDVNIRKRHRVIQYVRKIVGKAKAKERTIKVAPLHRFPSMKQDNDIQEFCRNCPSTSMSRFQEKEILKKINARGLEKHHPVLLKNTLKETREEFLKVTHSSGITMKLKFSDNKYKIEPYKHLGRTKNYSNFLERRRELQMKFLLHHPLIRRILLECVINLPYELANLSQFFQNQEMHTYEEFRNRIVDYINDGIQYLEEFYRKIVSLVEHETTYGASNYLGACSGLLSVNISRTIAHTLLHVVSFTGSKDHVPYLKLNITFNDRLILQPNADEIIDIYHTCLRKIINAAKQFYFLEERRNYKTYDHKRLHLCLTDDFFNSILNKVAHNIQEKYQPILNYVEQLQEDFLDINGDLLIINNETQQESDVIFSEGCQRILYLKTYLPKVNFIPDNEFFAIGQLTLADYRNSLKNNLFKIVGSIFNNLSAQHEWETNDICEAFDVIVMRATQKPITTEELIEIGKYMSWARNEFLEGLKERVINSLSYLSKLIELGPLSESHIKINAQAINWLDKIQPILDENTATYEQLKFEAEEKLQKVIEDINVDIKNVYPLLDILDAMDDIENVRNYLKDITLHMVKIREIESRVDWINREEVSLSFPKSSYAEYDDLKNYVYPFYHLLKLCLNVKRNLSVWLDGQFDLINYEHTRETVGKYLKELLNTQKVYRNKLRQAQDENLSLRFKGTVDDPDMLNWPAPLKLCSKAIKLIQDFEPSLTVIKIMCNEALMKRHWTEMSKITGFDITPNAGTTLRKIIQINLQPNMDNYELISISATQEKQLLERLNEMQLEWQQVHFITIEHNGIQIISQLEDIETITNDHIIKINMMYNTIFVKPYHNQVREFYNSLLTKQQMLQECHKTQHEILRNYFLLTCQRITCELPEETLIFENILTSYQKYIEIIADNSNVEEIVNSTNFLQDLITYNAKFETINKGINEYFEKIKNYFPRFYFLSNDELRCILSLTKTSTDINKYITKIFKFEEVSFTNSNEIPELISDNNGQREVLQLSECVATKEVMGRVEMWLKELEIQMKKTVSVAIKHAINMYDNLTLDWIKTWPYQILAVAIKTVFTAEIEHNMRNSKKLTVTVDNLIKLLSSSEIDNGHKFKIRSLIILQLNNKNIADNLMQNSVKNVDDFKWLVQMRHYCLDNLMVRIFDSSVVYGCEFLGNYSPIIITPLTERCYHNLIIAYNYHIYGICQGSTATGKTETINSLSNSLGLFSTFINCSAQPIDFKVLSNFLQGIVNCGSWLCFEEFENVSLETVSVLSQQMCKITSDQRKGLVKQCFICFNVKSFIPEMPESFKNLYRPITMTEPDCEIIAEITLCSYGFQHSKQLAKKIVAVLKTCEDVIPVTNNIFGLRTIKEILKLLGNNFDPAKNNTEALIYAIRFVISPRLSAIDLTLFDEILNRIVYSSTQRATELSHIESLTVTISENLNLQITKEFSIKMSQFDDLIKVKTGVIICGKTLTGKSTLIKILSEKIVDKEFINPKAISLRQLFGEVDNYSLQWKDGVITRCLRKSSESWIILDGPIDPIWIDNLNSVLDDNKKMCLVSGEVLYLKQSKLVFEVDNLENASPAMISRCGIVYMERSTFSWDCIIKSWISGSNFDWLKGQEASVSALFDWIIPPCLRFIESDDLGSCFEINYVGLVKTIVNLLEMLLIDAYEITGKKEEELKNLPSWIQASFILSCVWCFNSYLQTESCAKFDEFFKQQWKNPATFVEKIDVSVPQDGLIVDHFYIYKAKGSWKFWPDLLKNEKIEELDSFTDFLIPTTESVKYSWLINMFIAHNKTFLLTGPRAVGKTLYIQDILINKLDKHKYETSLINLICNVTANHTQKLILSKMFKKKSGHYGPSNGKTGILFIDDLHAPDSDKFGVQSSLELLREFFDYKNFYNFETNKAIYLDCVNIIGALDSSCNKKVSERFLRHFNIFSINTLPKESVLRIYSNILLAKYKKIGFPSDVIGTINQIVGATFNFYVKITDNLQPTPRWNFYHLHLRHFSKIMQVFSLIKKESFDSNKKLFTKLWVHEIFRAFGDRLENNDKNWFVNQITLSVKDDFKEELEYIFENEVLFGTFSDITCNRFDEVDLEKLMNISKTCLKDYNEKNPNSQFDIVLFDYALKHLSRICRTLALPSGNLLQVGVCGSGRQTLVKLASLIYNQRFFRLDIIQDYNTENWKNDIKIILKEAGGFGNQSVLFLREEQIINETILEDIDYLLKSGEVPFLYESLSEKQVIIDLVRESMQNGNPNIDFSFEKIFLNFQKRCKENLHIFLALSTESRNFRKYLQTYQSILKFCDIDCFEQWPSESLEEVASFWIADLQLASGVKNDALKYFSYFHNSLLDFRCLNVYVLTGSYFEFLKLYVDMIKNKQEKISNLKRRYLAALEKLSFAAVQISEMRKSLADYQPQLEAMTIKAIEMAQQIAKETIEVEIASNLVKQDEKIANEQAAAAQILKLDCEADLAQAIPILEDAISALNTLKPTDITLVKSMKNPPDAIKLVMAAVCVIKDVKPDRIPDPSTGRKTLDYWGPSKRILGDMNFLQSLKDFDKDNIKPEIMVKIRRDYLPHKDFKPHVVAKASSAAEGLCKWIIAMDMYDKVAKEVAPKKEKLEKAEQEYGNTMQILNEKKELVAKIEQKLADLNALLSEATKKQQILQRNVDACNRKLNRAQKLIGGLSEEKDRWTLAVKQLEIQFDNLPGDLLIASMMIAYLGPFKKEDRQNFTTQFFNFIRDKQEIPISGEKYDNLLLKVFEKDVDLDEWNVNGLPFDNFFLENGIIGKFSKRWCLYIDPQNKASNWIQRIEKYNGIKIAKYSSKNYINTIKDSIIFGKPVILQNISESIETIFVNLFTKQIYFKDSQEYINLGGEILPYNRNFVLYITCNLKNAQFVPEIHNRLTIIDFSLTKFALGEILLTNVVEVEKPNLKRVKKTLNQERKSGKEALSEIEDKILTTLSESTTDILEDEGALQMLDDSKVLSREIQKKQQDLSPMQDILANTKSDYVSISNHATVLYFCVYELSRINHMYQFSLEWFIDVYTESIHNAPRFRDLDKRLESLKYSISVNLYKKVSRSIFEKDKLYFSFMICVHLLMSQGRMTHQDINILTQSANRGFSSEQTPSWLPRNVWDKICTLTETLPRFKDFMENFHDNISSYENMFHSSKPELEIIPKEFDKNIEKFLLIASLRPDRFIPMIIKFVVEELGDEFVRPPSFDISVSFNESNTLSPLLFILRPESDPINSLLNFAKTKYFENKLILMCARSCEANILEKLIENGQKHGLWICLLNCHFITPWLLYLAIKLEEMDYNNTHENFRLWLTTNECEQFPIALLEKCSKITKDFSLKGVKNNLSQLFLEDPVNSANFFETCPGKSEEFSRLIYSLAFFHCLVQGRRSFDVSNWNIPYYEFKEFDFIFALRQLQSVVNNRLHPIRELYYLIGECNYGTHVHDKLDKRTIMTLLVDYINAEVISNRSYLFSGITSYGMPSTKTDHQDYIKHILNLPDDDNPEIYGLHTNYQEIKNFKQQTTFLENVDKVFKLEQEGNYSTLCSTMIDDLISKIPQEINVTSVLLNDELLIKSVILQEQNLFNKLITLIKQDSRILQEFINDKCLINEELENLYESVALNKIPDNWYKKSLKKCSENLVVFFEDLRNDCNCFKNYFEGQTNVVSLSSFFRPKSFLVARKMYFSTQQSVAFDSVSFQLCHVDKNATVADADIIIVDNVCILGANFDVTNNCLSDNLAPRKVCSNLDRVALKLLSGVHEKSFYKCPLFKIVGGNDTNLSNFILFVLVKSEKRVESWIKRGVCVALTFSCNQLL